MQRPSQTKQRWKSRLNKMPGLVPLVRLCRLVYSPAYRSEWLLKRARPGKLFQPYALTSHDRHPHIFSWVRDHLPDRATTRILSFGCSTGEEVFSLRHYFPQAGIAGIDINPRNIAICRNKLARDPDPRIRFVQSDSADAEPEGGYDAVFCLSVLRHGDLGAAHPESCGHLIRFEDFEKTVAGLCRCLRPGGYLIILGSNFRFCDTAPAAEFDVTYHAAGTAPRADTPLYDPGNRYLRNKVYNEVIFRKREIRRGESIIADPG